MQSSVLWRRLDQAGHECARLYRQADSWRLEGTAVFAHDGTPCRLDYLVICDSKWQTTSGEIRGWIGRKDVTIDVRVDLGHRWWLNGTERPEVAGCIDLDLNFSPSTNLLPIRRLALEAGQEAEVRAAWLRFPSFALESLDQVYSRTGTTGYRYESAGGSFTRDLEVSEGGLVLSYPGIWQAEAIL